MSEKHDVERAVAALFCALYPGATSADGRGRRDRPDWLARIGGVVWGMELTSFRIDLGERAEERASGMRADEAAVALRIRTKASKIGAYRRHTPEAARMGLVIHAEFWSRSYRLESEKQAARLVDAGRRVHVALGRPFDGLWLMRNARGAGDAGALWVIDGPSG